MEEVNNFSNNSVNSSSSNPPRRNDHDNNNDDVDDQQGGNDLRPDEDTDPNNQLDLFTPLTATETIKRVIFL